MDGWCGDPSRKWSRGREQAAKPTNRRWLFVALESRDASSEGSDHLPVVFEISLWNPRQLLAVDLSLASVGSYSFFKPDRDWVRLAHQ
jgi:hypothetical protein